MTKAYSDFTFESGVLSTRQELFLAALSFVTKIYSNVKRLSKTLKILPFVVYASILGYDCSTVASSPGRFRSKVELKGLHYFPFSFS